MVRETPTWHSCPAGLMVKQFRANHYLAVPPCAMTRRSPTKRLAITDEASPFALRSTRNHPRRAMHHGCVHSSVPRGSRERLPTARSLRSREDANLSRRSPQSGRARPQLVICWQIAGKRRFRAFRAWNRPGIVPGLSCWFGVEPPAGIEPATPSLPWIGGQAPCYPAFSQVTGDRGRRSYVLSRRPPGSARRVAAGSPLVPTTLSHW